MPPPTRTVRISLRSRVTCPHCWENFAPENCHWVAAHPELVNDPRLGADQQQRFLPTRFNPEGNAIDIRGMPCQELACPRCHLNIPRALLELPPFFVSIAGTPSCGKSYFLAAMTWMLRQTLPRQFQISYTDADPLSNRILNLYEEEQFLNPNHDEFVTLAKTQEQGDLYDVVRFGEQVVTFPRPFLFAIRPTQQHPSAANAKRVARLLCLYDNAGESFLPGRDTVVNPVTRHLAQSHVIMFCFDPTQDPRFRRQCEGKTTDFQIATAPVTARQETVLHEIVNRVRVHTSLKHMERFQRPLIVIVTKYDIWSQILGLPDLPTPWRTVRDGGLHGFDVQAARAVSQATRHMLNQITPELVTAAEEFSQQTWFLPVSATGCSPEFDPQSKRWGVRPRDIKPVWCEVPLLVGLCSITGGLVPVCRHGTAATDSLDQTSE